MSNRPTRIRLVLEIAPGTQPPRGRVRGTAGWLGFTGWTQLGQHIVRLAEPDHHDNPEEER